MQGSPFSIFICGEEVDMGVLTIFSGSGMIWKIRIDYVF